MDDEHLLDPWPQKLGKFTQEPLPHENRVVPAGFDVDACETHSCTFPLLPPRR